MHRSKTWFLLTVLGLRMLNLIVDKTLHENHQRQFLDQLPDSQKGNIIRDVATVCFSACPRRPGMMVLHRTFTICVTF
jgi:hypothetical protein